MSVELDLQACLPDEMRGASTAITRIAAGLSGAGVYRVECAGQLYVLKVSGEDEPRTGWRERLALQQRASDAGVTPRIVHADEGHRAVLTAFVTDRSFPMLFWNPATREAALTLLGQTLRRLHDLPLPAGVEARDARAFLTDLWARALVKSGLPRFVGDVVERALDEAPPPRDRAPVFSHNDVNPTNLAYDGERLLLLDWQTAGANDPFYDLAAIAVFLRMDEATCLALLSAYEGKPVTALHPSFLYSRRMVAALCGVAFVRMARHAGHPGATGSETLESSPSLADVYQRMRAGALSVGAAEGQWAFGLALLKASATL